MEARTVETRQAYELIRQVIITLALAPGAPVDGPELARQLSLAPEPVIDALKLLAHDGLVRATRQGWQVAEVDLFEMEQIAEVRLSLEPLCARLAAQRATTADRMVLAALRQEQGSTSLQPASDNLTTVSYHLLDLDFRFHRAVGQAAHNRALARTLEEFFILSQRLWYLVLPRLGFLPVIVESHLDLVEAIGAGNASLAEQIMADHIKESYAKVWEVLKERE